MLSSPPFAGRPVMGFVGFVFALLVFPLLASAQEKPRVDQKTDEDVIELRAQEVSIPVTVRDRKSGNLVPSLDKKDFKIFEDGVEQQISYFSAERVPANIVLLIDTSSSVESEIDNIKQSAWDFIRQMGDKDTFSIITFTDTVDLILDWTSDKNKALKALNNLTTGKFTAFNDALYLAATEQLKDIKGRKAIIVLSDGIDNRASTTSQEQAYDAVMRSEASVYIVSKTAILKKRLDPRTEGYEKPDGTLFVPAENRSDYDKKVRIMSILKTSEEDLTRLSQDTGGRIYLPMTMLDLGTAYSQVANELKSQYLVNFVSSNTKRDGQFRWVKVKLAGQDLRAYSRGGYYAPGDDVTVTLKHP